MPLKSNVRVPASRVIASERGQVELDRRGRGGFEEGQGEPGEVVVEAGVAVRVGVGVGVGKIVRGRGVGW